MSTQTNKPIDSFPYVELSPIATNGEDPTYEQIKLLQLQVVANAKSIESREGTGKHGLLALAVGENQHRKTTRRRFRAPRKPRSRPSIRPHASTGEVARATRKHDDRVRQWNMYNNTIKALLTQLLKATPRHLIAELADREGDFSDVMPHEIISHLKQNYGAITPAMLTKNLEELTQPNWKLTDPITNLWAHTKKCMDFAIEGREEIAETVVVRGLEKILRKTGAFDLDLRDWEQRSKSKRTLRRFKEYFATANQRRKQHATALSEGYAGKAETPTKPSDKDQQHNTNTNMSYCWSHGLNESHDSPTCKAKDKGHKDEATVDNVMGGNNMIQRRRGEKRVFEFPEKDNKKKKSKKKDE